MADWDTFKHGGVQYPLVSATTNSLLQDADPALFYALEFLAASLRRHIGPRLAAQALLEKLKITNAVAQTLHTEPSPFLLSDQFRFPALALYRKNEEESGASLVYGRDTAEWEFAYVLPSLTPRQVGQLQPILRAASRVIAHAVSQGFEPSHRAGANIWKLAGIEQARLVRASYGGYEPINETPHYFRSVVGTIAVVERDMAPVGHFQAFNGANATLTDTSVDGTPVDVSTLATYPAPTLTTATPNTGSRLGGTVVTILGAGFLVGQPVRVWFGSVEATSASVLSATQVRCTTPVHGAYPTFISDITVRTFSGQEVRLPAAFTFTSP